MTELVSINKNKFRYNIFYSSPNYYLYDGDDKGILIFKSTNENIIKEKQLELEKEHKLELNSKYGGKIFHEQNSK